MLILSACSSGPNFSLRQKQNDHSGEVALARTPFIRAYVALSEGIRVACAPSHHSIPLGTPISAKTIQSKNRN